jgi:hypothetical protein
MKTSGLQPTSFDATATLGKTGRISHRPSPPPQGDSVQISPEAMQKLLSAPPDAVTSAVADLKGNQASMAADFKIIGDHFADHGGREALDAFMRSNFTEAELRAFPPPAEGARRDPRPPLQDPSRADT